MPKRTVVQELVSLPAWNKKLAELTTPREGRSPVILITGPKSSGKSTFGRILGNRLLTGASRLSKRQSPAIAVLDLDLGQPEYGPPGTVALVKVNSANLAPSFARPIIDGAAVSILRMHAMASVSPAQDPELYVEAALDLYNRYQQSPMRNRPLIINTPGWILGTGLDILTELITRINPSDVLYMSEDGPMESVDAMKGATRASFAVLPSQQAEFASRTAAHLRAMHTMSYFHASAPSSQGEMTWDPSPLSTKPPLQTQYAGENAGILGIMSYDFQPPAELLADTVNGCVLALVEIEDGKAFRDLWQVSETTETLQVADDANAEEAATKHNYMALVSRTAEDVPFISNADARSLDPRYSQCLGLVLLRGIDTQKKQLQLLTPVPLSRIQESNKAGKQLVLLHGKFDTPGWAYTEYLYSQSYKQGAPGNEELESSLGEYDDGIGEDGDMTRAIAARFEGKTDAAETPWVEVLQDNEKRPIGSSVWRVRRDLGKGGP